MTTINENLTENISISMSFTARLRTNFAIGHLLAAARFSRQTGSVQSAHQNDDFGDWWEEMLHNSVACLFLATASLESYANELFADRETVFPGLPAHVTDKVWELSERKPPLEKLDIVLELKQRLALDRKADLYKALLAVVRLRNELTHFKPEWSDEADKHKKISDVLRGQFQYDDRHFKTEDIFPRAWAGHGCTSWAVKTVTAFLKEFEILADLAGRTDWKAFEARLAS
ncbi:hypothetical protein ACNJYA_09270 [Bradyrhizobium sp. DASA03068]|uniref:hypothetical protein n=1 Tax=Bradyrhizobium sp. BLXBL-01 TaxID=3395915 RepID=UPI003F71232B